MQKKERQIIINRQLNVGPALAYISDYLSNENFRESIRYRVNNQKSTFEHEISPVKIIKKKSRNRRTSSFSNRSQAALPNKIQSKQPVTQQALSNQPVVQPVLSNQPISQPPFTYQLVAQPVLSNQPVAQPFFRSNKLNQIF
jgi:isopentenyldiphosphate isomerase